MARGEENEPLGIPKNSRRPKCGEIHATTIRWCRPELFSLIVSDLVPVFGYLVFVYLVSTPASELVALWFFEHAYHA